MTADYRRPSFASGSQSWEPPSELDTSELVKLYHGVKASLGGRSGVAVAMAGATKADEVALVACSLGWVGHKMLGKRILFVDLTSRLAPSIMTNSPLPPMNNTLGLQAISTSPPDQAPMRLPVEGGIGVHRTVGLFSLTLSPAKDLAVTAQLTRVWPKLRPAFDLIIVAAPPVLDDPTAVSLSGLVDGTVLVVTTGKSRYREVSRASNLLTGGATPLLGVVMMDPRRKRGWFRRSKR